MKIPIGNYCGYTTTIGEKCGYSATLGKYAWILSYYWGLCGYSAGIEPNSQYIKFCRQLLYLVTAAQINRWEKRQFCDDELSLSLNLK